jgi:hypothetical protein
MKKLLIITLVLLGISCEDTIDPKLEDTLGAYTVDAWINNQSGMQRVFVALSQPYFENELPTLIRGAEVFIEDLDGARFDFLEGENGYFWGDSASVSFAQEGMGYLLNINVDGYQFASYTEMGRVPEIDSIEFSFEEANEFIVEDHYFGEFVATDPVGEGDTYWIKTWKNGQYLNKPDEIIVAYDAGFSPGGNADGLVFIQPIRFGVNPFDENPDVANEFIPPYSVGDSIYVEIHSIDIPAFYFWNEVIIQTNRVGGFGALFAQPVANVSTNIYNADQESEIRPYGFFNVSAITGRGTVLTQEIADEAKRIWEEEQR